MSLAFVGIWLLAYLAGSLPFGLWITRALRGVDIRDGGSGHITTTNTIRQAGWLPGALVLLLDMAKGYLPVWLGLRLGMPLWAIALTAALVVAGHCWPIFAQFRGGMGWASAGGTILAAQPVAFLVGLSVLLFFVLVIKHAARGSLIAALLIPVAFWLTGMNGAALWASLGACVVVALRFTIDWNRKYRELWLDREKKSR